MKKTVMFALGMMAILVIACSPDPGPIPANYWPLAEGNQWMTTEDYAWIVTGIGADTSSSTTTNTVEPLEERDDGKLVWPVATSTQGDSTIFARTYYHVTTDSVFMYNTDKNLDKPSAVEPNNLSVGTKWNGKLALPVEIPYFSSEFDAYFEVVSETTITVPAGTFNCMVIDIDLTEYELESAVLQWRSEGFGMIQMRADFVAEIDIGFGTITADVDGTSQMYSKSGF